MKFSYNWLQKHFEEKLPEANELAKKIGLHSFELEGVEEIKIGDEKDFLIEWDILPNRSSDCLCYMGMAKEISAVLDTPHKMFISDNVLMSEYSKEIKTSDFISLEIENEKLVKRATKRIAINVEIKESPQWLKTALESMGQKSINNVVDITNYVMWTTGQPVHAFDYDKLAGEENKKNIKIGFAKDGEKIIDLSGLELELDSSVLVISDGEKSLDIAGIKGGNISGVDENTTRLMLSAVNFEYENIRNTSKKLKLSTDASKRFENEIPLRKVTLAMAQMSYLLKELAGAEISDDFIDTNSEFNGNKKITCSFSKINSLLGLNISEKEIIEILHRLDLRGEKDIQGDSFEVNIPEDRLDLNIWQDIAEEVGRIYGYENITEKFPSEKFSVPEKNSLKISIRKIMDVLVQEGFYEVYNRSLVKDGEVFLENSLNSNATALRNNLLSSLKEKVEKNFQHSAEPRFFEIGKVFTGVRDGEVIEEFSFAGVVGKKKIKEKHQEDLFYQTKGYLEKIFQELGVKNISWKSIEEEGFIAEIKNLENESLGKIGINFWEIKLEKLIKEIDNSIIYSKTSKFPKIEKDVSFWVSEDFTVDEAEKLINSVLGENLISVELFDIYKDKENNKKSFAYNVIFQSKSETLSDEFANGEMEKVYNLLKEKGFETR